MLGIPVAQHGSRWMSGSAIEPLTIPGARIVELAIASVAAFALAAALSAGVRPALVEPPGRGNGSGHVAGLLTAPDAQRNPPPPGRSPSPSLPSSPLPPWPAPSLPPTEPVVQDPATSAPITAESVARHYLDVGRKIRTFALVRGAEAASKLWERFRYIRINDALVDPVKRSEIDARLRRIEDSLAADCPR